MKLVIDVNMHIEWKDVLTEAGFEAVRWRDFADRRADDSAIMHWAAEHGYVVITQDLDFGTALALLHLDRPSVVTLRTRHRSLQRSVQDVLWLLRTYEVDLEEGALLTIDPDNQRIRKLPFD